MILPVLLTSGRFENRNYVIIKYRYPHCSGWGLETMKRIYLIAPIVAVIMFFLISRVIVNSLASPADTDFFTFWLGGRLISLGKDPYSIIDWVSGHHIYGATWIPNLSFVYPFPLSLFFIPFGLLEEKLAFTLWVFITLIILVICIFLLIPIFGSQKYKLILPIFAGLIIFRPLFPLLLGGQISALILLSITLGIVLWEKNHWISGGIFTALSLLKPQIGLFYVGLMTIYLLLNKKYSAIIGIFASAIGLFLLGAIVNPDWLLEFFSIISRKYDQIFGFAPTVWGMAFYLTDFSEGRAILLGWIFSTIFFAWYILLLWKAKNLPPIFTGAAAILTTLTITPSIWPYDQILLVIPILTLLALSKRIPTKPLLTSLIFPGISALSFFLYWQSSIIQLENLNFLLTFFISFLFILGIIKATNGGHLPFLISERKL